MTEMIESIKADIPHESDCASLNNGARFMATGTRWPCNCSRRKKIARLDDDESLFTMALEILDGKRSIADWREWEERVRKRAAEEDHD